MEDYSCPCCGYLTISEEPPGTYEICPICRWEDDNVQFYDIDFRGGANEQSLREARANFKEFKAAHLRFIKRVREPLPDEIPKTCFRQTGEKVNSYYCRVCGLEQPEPPWGDDDATPSNDICACCGVEFGYEDFLLKGIISYRNHWIKKGAKWFKPKCKPNDWSLEDQMNNVLAKYK